jgi:hypothetical protein
MYVNNLARAIEYHVSTELANTIKKLIDSNIFKNYSAEKFYKTWQPGWQMTALKIDLRVAGLASIVSCPMILLLFLR